LQTSFLKETILSLNMLFPQWDSGTQALLRAHGQTFDSEAPFEGPTQSSLYEFSIWRDRMLELYEEVYKAPPGTWAQLWLDRRNPHQWWTFWIALAVIVPLSTISCVASVVQAVVSVKSFQLQKPPNSG